MTALDASEIEHFIRYGFVHLHGCFDAGPDSLARRWVDASWSRAEVDPEDRATWPTRPVALTRTDQRPVREFAPRAYAAICQLLGGVERIKNPDLAWGDQFLINYAVGWDEDWVAPGPAAPPGINWHVDGSWFEHFLDSPEQGLLSLVMWTDLEHRGGATFVCCDSIAPVARFLHAHPEGVAPGGFPWSELIADCRDFREVTGRAGDVVLVHPLLMHRGSQNPRRRHRVISNAVSSLKEPMCFDRDDGAYSPVELTVLHALGVERLPFRISGQRRFIPPEERGRPR